MRIDGGKGHEGRTALIGLDLVTILAIFKVCCHVSSRSLGLRESPTRGVEFEIFLQVRMAKVALGHISMRMTRLT